MKSPYKIIGLAIIGGVALYAAWPTETVRDHDPVTGEGVPGHDHDHAVSPDPEIPEKAETDDRIPVPDNVSE